MRTRPPPAYRDGAGAPSEAAHVDEPTPIVADAAPLTQPPVEREPVELNAPQVRSSKRGYRWDIQGMRAVAVVLVVLAHADVPGMAGGFIGVDVFFVISGFLITGLLLEDGERHHRIGFARFYARRARRILPAATLVIVVASIASLLILNAYQARSDLVDGMWAGFFALNVRLARAGTDYFTRTAPIISPLQHYWSLSVEEQFYVVWPALLAITGLGFRARRRARGTRTPRTPARTRIAIALVLLGAGSLYLSITQTSQNPHAAYFSTLDRAWELIIGALLAVVLPQVARMPGLARAALTWSGLAGIGYAVATFTATTPVPGSVMLIPVLSTAAVLAGGVGTPRLSAARLLSLGPFRFIGAISYSLYLWHWPILVLAAAYFPFPLSLSQRLALLGGATVVAVLSYAFVEIPFQRAKRLTRRAHAGLVLWPVALSMIVIVALLCEAQYSFVSAAGPANPALRAPTAVVQAVEAANARLPIPNATAPNVLDATSDFTFIGKCSAWQQTRSRICEMGDPTGTKTIVVFGNSHSTMWIPTISILARQAKWRFFPVVKEACGYDDYAGLRHIGIRNPCVEWYRWALRILGRLHPDVVILGAYGYRSWAKGLSSELPQLKRLTKRLVLIADVPGVNVVPGYCLSQANANQSTCLFPESQQRITDVSIARRLATVTHIGFVNPERWFCYLRLCPSVINGMIPYYDTSHVTIDYAKYLAPDLGSWLGLTRPKH